MMTIARDGDHIPAAEGSNLPDWARGLYFGRPSVYDGHLYEDDYSYLARLNLLFDEEKAIFEKYESVINVHIAQGGRGECAPCLERAREIAKQIGFDIDSASRRYEFLIPGDLYVECEHCQYNVPLEIFVDAD